MGTREKVKASNFAKFVGVRTVLNSTSATSVKCSIRKLLEIDLLEPEDCNTGDNMTSKLNGLSRPVAIREAGSNTRSSPLFDGRRLCALAIVLAAWTTFAQPQPEAPRPPNVPSSPGQDDKNGNRIDDSIDIEIHEAYITLANRSATEEAKSQARARLAGRIEVIVSFNRQIASEEWGLFVALGGQVESGFETGAHGWAGSIAREQMPALAIFMGPELIIIKKTPQPPIRFGFRSGPSSNPKAR